MIYTLVKIITIIGAVSWGIVGVTSLFQTRFEFFEYVIFTLSDLPFLLNIVYIAIGVSAIIFAFLSKD